MPKKKQPPHIWTIGHSTHPLEKFISMLQSFNIELLADIRGLPGSRRYPHFDKENLEQSLPQHDIAYRHFKELGGRRRASRDSVNTAWRHPAFRGYADYMQTPEFKEAIKQLADAAQQQRIAYMCSEAVWWRCHRALVSDHLKVNGWTVIHIMDIDKAREHPYTSAAKVIGKKVSYEG